MASGIGLGVSHRGAHKRKHSWVLGTLLVMIGHGGTVTAMPATLAEATEQDTRAAYADTIQAIASRRAVLSDRYKLAQDDAGRGVVIAEAQREILSSVESSLAPCWYGTPWAFHGTTETPLVGEIACGYFVSTLFRDAGFNVERVRMAQQPAELIIKSLVAPDQIKRFSNASIDSFVQAVKDWGTGLYVVGLDIHVGFIVNGGEGVFFIHSSYAHPYRVVREKAEESRILTASAYRVLGRLSADDDLAVRWMNGETIPTKTR